MDSPSLSWDSDTDQRKALNFTQVAVGFISKEINHLYWISLCLRLHRIGALIMSEIGKFSQIRRQGTILKA